MERGIKSPSLRNWSQGVATRGLRPTPQALTQPGFAAPTRKNSAWRLKHLSHSSKEERALTLIQKLSLKIFKKNQKQKQTKSVDFRLVGERDENKKDKNLKNRKRK